MNAKDLDILEKRRLASRTFGFVRHTVYRTKELVEPPQECTHYAPDECRLDKDFDSLLRADNNARKVKQEKQRVFRGAHQAYRDQKVYEEREKQWETKLRSDYFLRIKEKHPNKGGAPYNFISMEYDDGYEGQKLKYLEEMATCEFEKHLDSILIFIRLMHRWRAGLRRLRIQSKMSGTRNLNVINWQKVQQMNIPAKPQPFLVRSPPRPCTAPPEPPKMPVVAIEAARPISALPPKKSDASEDYHWELYHYVHKPYKFK
ncbi:hypothetical protein SELMODRAFT_429164 [Selaginella moellendorffii]|uniref:Uncharacterized protein n=1 Tax=Selaginella moellendorffii TaxID=88036 RepID=D8T591_SELML|nr:hypothetical protein SELMODRAFT_429164 [Selaginella moellendorffii]